MKLSLDSPFLIKHDECGVRQPIVSSFGITYVNEQCVECGSTHSELVIGLLLITIVIHF